MTLPSVPEADRLAALHALEILDTPAEAHFDAVCRTAKALFDVPGCAVSLVDAERHWFKASCGLDVRQADRATSFCTHAIATDRVLVVEDATGDPRFADNPWVVGPAQLRFYAGAPLVLEPGLRVGSLCLTDTRPRAFSEEDRARLADLASVVVAHLRLQRETVARREQQAEEALRTAALREANHLLSLAEQVGEVGHWRVRLADKRREWSPETYRIRGLAPGSALPPVTDTGFGYHPDDRDRVRVAFEAAIREAQDFLFEARIVRPDGEVRDVLVRGICETDAVGRAVALFGVIIDLTDHKRMEAILATSTARYDALADALPQIVWMMRVSDGHATYVNSQFARYYGPIGPERTARLARNHPDDADRMERAWQRAREDGEPFEVEARLARADGAYRWHKLVMIPIRKDGEIAEWIGTALDIDEIVKARSALEETTDLLRLAQEAADVGPWSWDLRTGMMRLSPDSAKLHGLTAEAELPTAEWTACVHPEDRAHVWQNVRIAVEAGSSLAAEYRVGGTEDARWVRVQGRVVYNGEGLPSRMVGLHFDISARKAVETALAEAKARAEEAQRVAEEANAAKSDFLATMSHEIRTPLNGVIGYADVLAQEGPLTPRQRLHVERVRSAGGALLTVVNDILDFSRIEAGQIEIDASPFSFATLVDAAVAIVRPEAERKGLTLSVRIDETTPLFLMGDEGRLRQVLLNLLGNAVKFTPSGRVSLAVCHEGEDAVGTRLRIAVTDTGIGIPADKRDRLFARFSQVDGSIQRRYGGTGLGLAISKQLIELMGGTIGIESREGVGSTFWFAVALPRADAPAAEPERARSAPDAAAARLLLAEDVPTNQELARMILEAAGYEVDIVWNGAEALAALEARPYDLVLMDVQMPVMDGITAARAIRALDDPRRRDVPIIAMTANVMPQHVGECRAAGMVDCVGKPYRREELYAAIERWLPRPALREPPRMASDPRAAALDESVYDTMRTVMGRERIGELLADLARELRMHFDGPLAEPDREKLSFSAHAMASATGMLGFTGFSQLCREVEEACAGNADLAPLVGRLAQAQAATLERIATMIAA